MRGVVLAGGLGTRLRPLTLVTNKHLLPVYDEPMIHFAIRTLALAGMEEVLVVTGRDHADDFRRLLRDGRHLGASRLEFACQSGEGGIADALKHAEDFADGGKVCVMLGDNLVERSIRPAAERFLSQPSGARLLLKEVPDPRGLGVARFRAGSAHEPIVEIVEKPARPPSTYAVIGIYFYDADVFGMCRSVRPSARGELEITDVNNAYVRRGDLTHEIVDGWWADAGTFDGLLLASTLVAQGKTARAVDAHAEH